MNRRADLIEIGVRLESCADEKKRGFYLVFLRVAFFLRRFACLYMFAIFFSLLLSFSLGAFSHQYLLSRNSTFARITTFHLTKSNFAFCSIRLGEALNSSITKYWRENYWVWLSIHSLMVYSHGDVLHVSRTWFRTKRRKRSWWIISPSRRQHRTQFGHQPWLKSPFWLSPLSPQTQQLSSTTAPARSASRRPRHLSWHLTNWPASAPSFPLLAAPITPSPTDSDTSGGNNIINIYLSIITLPLS